MAQVNWWHEVGGGASEFEGRVEGAMTGTEEVKQSQSDVKNS